MELENYEINDVEFVEMTEDEIESVQQAGRLLMKAMLSIMEREDSKGREFDDVFEQQIMGMLMTCVMKSLDETIEEYIEGEWED